MIHVTQGHEKSISTEVFLKSFLCLKKNIQEKIIFYCDKNSLIENLEYLNLNYSIDTDTLIYSGQKLKINLCNPKQYTISLSCILNALENINSQNDFLFTLPTSKDQFEFDNKHFSGHTSFLEYYFKTKVQMNFVSPDLNFLLITDHIPLSKIPNTLNTDLYLKQVKTCVNWFKKRLTLRSVKELVFYGINPHSGENYTLGKDEKLFESLFPKLKSLYPDVKITGPLAADSFTYSDKNIRQLHIFAYHDQALGIFKSISGFSGINFTTGLPFYRLSPDHGTAFDLYQKNCANYQNLNYCFDFIEDIIHG